MRRILFLLFHFYCFAIVAQLNQLIINPGFEDPVQHLPSTKRNTVKIGGISLVSGWLQAGNGSVDYYNSDLSTANKNVRVHKARTGEGRIGMILGRYTSGGPEDPNYREFVQTQMMTPMEKGKTYSVNFFIVKDKRSRYYSESIGAYFSHEPSGRNGLNVNAGLKPQVTGDEQIMTKTSGWSLVHGYYTAKGGESYMTIGAFTANNLLDITTGSRPAHAPKLFTSAFSQFAYYYIDDVYVYEVSDPDSDNYLKIIPKDLSQQAYNNFVLALDVSTSMEKYNKIEALKKSVDSLLSSMDENETISIVTFDAQPKILVKGMQASEKERIIAVIDSLKTGGGTNVNAALANAYALMDSTFIPGGNNKVILITDALFQLTKTSQAIIEKHQEEKNIDLLTLVLNDTKYNSVKKIKRNNGPYKDDEGSTTFDILDLQVEERVLPDYGPGRKHTNEYLLKPLLVISALALVIFLKSH
ncbi:MAG: VWA domain-containing protein [Bacteroidia bacterium]